MFLVALLIHRPVFWSRFSLHKYSLVQHAKLFLSDLPCEVSSNRDCLPGVVNSITHTVVADWLTCAEQPAFRTDWQVVF